MVDGATTLSVCFIGDDVANAETETVNAGDNGDLNVEDAVSAKIKGTDADNDLAVVAVDVYKRQPWHCREHKPRVCNGKR